jgi:hypothetical protein
MMKMTHIQAIALLGALTLSTPAAALGQETERVDRTAAIRAGGQLRVKNFSGRVTITGSRRTDVAIHAVRHGSRDRLDNIKLEVTETSSGVTIEANKKSDNWRDHENNVVETELDIQVPVDVTLDIDVFSSDVHVSDVTGRQRLHSFSGEIEVTNATGSVDAETFSGDIELTLAQGAGGNVDFDSFSGELRGDSGLVTRSARSRRVTGTVGTGGSSDYHLKTFSGSARIK